ncbi:MarR family winged helix-turn-helix transcriptional regulator [Benzoatithermus flavus]|uniref:MarR family transcriptional regulator n=1 Tax=Benzoatithermus flavus TaxID=3108223 RepID=A0ABU8XUH2_9PROT
MPRLQLLKFMPFRLNRLAAEVSGDLAKVYAERFGIDIPEWRVLATLAVREPRSAQFIVRCTRTHKTRISRAVSRLLELGLIERAGNGGDRRETLLRMTEKGRALYEEIVPFVLERERQVLSCLSEDERRSFDRALSKLEQALGLVQDPDQLHD